MRNLEFSGDCLITDPNTGAEEKVQFSGPFDEAKVIYSPTKYRGEDGRYYPQFKVEDVALESNPGLIVVSTFGNLPLYKSH